MTVLSVFGASAPPGTYAVYTDGTPSIRLGQRFYRSLSSTIGDAATIVGGRVWIPAAVPGATGVRIMLWVDSQPITATPMQSVVVPLAGTGWHEGTFPAATAIPPLGTMFRVGYEFVGNAAAYGFTATLRPDLNNQAIVGPQGLALAEAQSVYRMGSGGEQNALSYGIAYGVDVLVDDGSTPSNLSPVVSAGVDQSVAFGATVTLTGTASDNDGTISSTSWQQLSGGGVTLTGTGLVRTFVADRSGVLTFQLTATDDDGATTSDTVQVVVAPAPVIRAATSSGALKAIIEGAGLSISAYRDDIPKRASMPCVTLDENVATSQERHGDTGDPLAHAGESELLNVHVWELWRNDEGKPAERYELVRDLKRALRTARPFEYGPLGAPIRCYGIRIDGHARIVEDEENVVHHTITCTLRRDA